MTETLFSKPATAPPAYSETKFYILLGVYVGAWGIVPGLTPKLIPLDLSGFGLGVLAFSFGAFLHAITFPCTDTVSEVWGARRARLIVYLGAGIYALAIAGYLIAVTLPPAPGWPHDEAYTSIFSPAGRMILGSITATLVAQFLDIYLFEKIKKMTGKKWLWLRNNGSTAVSQFVDTAIFYSIAFYGIIPSDLLPLLVLGTYLVKLLLTAIDTPIVYLLVRWITGKWAVEAPLEADQKENEVSYAG